MSATTNGANSPSSDAEASEFDSEMAFERALCERESGRPTEFRRWLARSVELATGQMAAIDADVDGRAALRAGFALLALGFPDTAAEALDGFIYRARSELLVEASSSAMNLAGRLERAGEPGAAAGVRRAAAVLDGRVELLGRVTRPGNV